MEQYLRQRVRSGVARAERSSPKSAVLVAALIGEVRGLQGRVEPFLATLRAGHSDYIICRSLYLIGQLASESGPFCLSDGIRQRSFSPSPAG
ncbi:hypothetical protein NKH23_34180, partial [Mesorhizobium sp. M1328]|uniref:hypothetical protein n=1 Tax=Mesorhizobium sp. M1328 TaxID=2957082 RepID=UPI003335B639